MGIECPNEDDRLVISFIVDRMRWRPVQSTDKVRRSFGSSIKSVYNTQPRGGGHGNGS
jgi:hypothetical protein